MHSSNYPCPTSTNSNLENAHSSTVWAQLHQLWHKVKQGCEDWLATRNEPKVTQQFDRQGRSLGWRVFDPETGYTISFGSELEVRLWLEHRYQ